MEATAVLFHSKTIPFCFPPAGNGVEGSKRPSCRHFNKHLQLHLPNTNFRSLQNPKSIKSSYLFSFPGIQTSSLLKLSRPHFVSSLKCSYSSSAISGSFYNQPLLKPFKSLSFDNLKDTLLKITPIDVVKWSGVLSFAIAATKWIVKMLLDPFFWMYFSWTWLFWPWLVAISLVVYGFYCFHKHSLGKASVFEQLAIVASVFTWLTLVPPAHFNGYLEGWPFVFFFVYLYFFFFNVSVRRRLYGDYYMRPHDPKWDLNTPKWHRLLFCAGVLVGHWLAAFEGPELHLIPGGWRNVGIWILIVVTLLMQYNSTFYLAKYSEKVVVPTAVVQFGPYRWIRHPIYSSTMLLFATYFIALRAPMSLLFLLSVCLIYYTQKAKMEEDLMVETFGERYLDYTCKVRFKFIPFVY